MKILDYEGLKQLTNKIKEKLNEKLTINNLFEQTVKSKTKGSTTLSDELKKIEDKVALKADSKDMKTKLSEMEEDSTHRTVTDTEKSNWNGKLSSISGVDLSRGKTGGYGSATAWTEVSNRRDLENWIGDFDKRTKENRDGLGTRVLKSDVINSLTSTETNKPLSANMGKTLNESKIDKSKIATGQSATPMLYQAVVMKMGAKTDNVPDGTVIYFIE